MILLNDPLTFSLAPPTGQNVILVKTIIKNLIFKILQLVLLRLNVS